MLDARATMFKSWLISRNQKRAAETLVPRTASTMREQVVSTGGRATRAIVRAQDKRIGELPEEKAVNPRGSSCTFHCESRAYNLARFMANPSSGEPVSGATCVADA